MGCHSHGPASTKAFHATAGADEFKLEVLATVMLDLRPSEIPEWADRDWFRQRIIDRVAVLAGELTQAEVDEAQL